MNNDLNNIIFIPHSQVNCFCDHAAQTVLRSALEWSALVAEKEHFYLKQTNQAKEVYREVFVNDTMIPKKYLIHSVYFACRIAVNYIGDQLLKLLHPTCIIELNKLGQ